MSDRRGPFSLACDCTFIDYYAAAPHARPQQCTDAEQPTAKGMEDVRLAEELLATGRGGPTSIVPLREGLRDRIGVLFARIQSFNHITNIGIHLLAAEPDALARFGIEQLCKIIISGKHVEKVHIYAPFPFPRGYDTVVMATRQRQDGAAIRVYLYEGSTVILSNDAAAVMDWP